MRNRLKPFQCHRWWNMQCQLLGLDDAELLLSVSESVSSLLLLAACWAFDLDLEISPLPGGSEAPLLSHEVCPLIDDGLPINVGMLCGKRRNCHRQQKCFKIQLKEILKGNCLYCCRELLHVKKRFISSERSMIMQVWTNHVTLRDGIAQNRSTQNSAVPSNFYQK